MEKNNTRSIKRWATTDTIWMTLATGLHVVVTLALPVFSSGVTQIRLSEMFNHLSSYNKRYIVAVAAGIALANIVSPLGLVDAVIGSVSTPIVLLINYKIVSRIKNMKIKMAATACVFALSMFIVAGQLTILYQLPFFLNWWVIALGGLVSMIVGGIIIYRISKKADLAK